MTAEKPQTRSVGIGPLSLLGALAYFILIGGSSAGDLSPGIRLVNAAMGGALVARYALVMSSRSDRIDRLALIALLLFAIAGIIAEFPRTALDAVMGTLGYVAALFVARELLARHDVRRSFGRLLIGLSTLFTLVAAALWLPSIVGWWAATGWRVVPPLDLNLSSFPWGHRYDLALLLAMLYPAWWMDRPSPTRRIAAIVVGAADLVLIIGTGSRTVALALVFATILAGWPMLRRRLSSPSARQVLAGAVAVLALAVLVTGIGSSLLQRAFTGASLEARIAMWVPLVDQWTSKPIAGIGPGSFPWALQLTGYFNDHTWAPRHPDNAIAQLLPEAGVLGLAAAAVLAVTVLPAVLRGPSIAARWVVVLFVVASMGANPTDFPFLVVALIGWVAYAVPHSSSPSSSLRLGKSQRLRMALIPALGLVGLAQALTLVGAFSYAVAVDAVGRGDIERARSALNLSVAVDPGMALYWRQRGVASLMLGDRSAGLGDLRDAVHLNPADDLAWRTLSVAAGLASDQPLRNAAINRALTVQRGDVANMLLAARAAGAAGDLHGARALLAEVVQSWPGIVSAPGWSQLLPPNVSTADVVGDAKERWISSMPTPETRTNQGIWLGVLAGDEALVAEEIKEADSPRLAGAQAAALRCDLPVLRNLLEEATPSEMRSTTYWSLRLSAASLDHTADGTALDVLGIMTGQVPTRTVTSATIAALNENSSFSGDTWGYRRPPIAWDPTGPRLPSPAAGTARWTVDPRRAAVLAGLADRLPQCESPSAAGGYPRSPSGLIAAMVAPGPS